MSGPVLVLDPGLDPGCASHLKVDSEAEDDPGLPPLDVGREEAAVEPLEITSRVEAAAEPLDSREEAAVEPLETKSREEAAVDPLVLGRFTRALFFSASLDFTFNCCISRNSSLANP